jgi:hypothetical protein
VDVELVYFEGCPHAETTYERILEAAAARPDIRVTKRLVATQADAERHQLHGSPTVLLDGVDPFVGVDTPIAWACRIYETPSGRSGCPTVGMLNQAIAGHPPR